MFLFPARLFLDEVARFEPAMAAAVAESVGSATQDLDFVRLAKDGFSRAPAKSIDYAVMEKTDKAAVVPASLGWNDVGAWSALWDIGKKDNAGNVMVGDVIAHETSNSYLRSDRLLLATLGISDARGRRHQRRGAGRRQGPRPGRQEDRRAAQGEGPQRGSLASDRLPAVGQLPVDRQRPAPPGQAHHGQARRTSCRCRSTRTAPSTGSSSAASRKVTRDEDILTLRENMSTYLPVGCVHRLENPGPANLHLIEVQSGGYLGEDDIVRLEDTYGRR